jgi:hypothetical protein
MFDYVRQNANEDMTVSVRVLWKALIEGLESIWPQRLSGVRRGDVWSHHLLKVIQKPGSDFVPFHKLTQWLCYSLIEVFQLYGFVFTDLEEMTGLAEYRNGGLFIDTGVIVPRKDVDKMRMFDVGSELVVEWRALTICLLDELAKEVRKKFEKTEEEMPLYVILEGGTWQAGRDLAEKLRHGLPPLQIRSDGTIF